MKAIPVRLRARVASGLMSMGVGGLAGLLGIALLRQGAPRSGVFVAGLVSAVAGIALPLRGHLTSRPEMGSSIGVAPKTQQRLNLDATTAVFLLAAMALLLYAWLPDVALWVYMACSAGFAGGSLVRALTPAQPSLATGDRTAAVGVAEETVLVKLHPDGVSLPGALLAGMCFVALIGIANRAGVSPLIQAGLVVSLQVAAVIVVLSRIGSGPVMVLSEESIAVQGGLSKSSIPWGVVASVDLSEGSPIRGFPRALCVRSAADFDAVLSIRLGRIAPPEVVGPLLCEIFRHCPVSRIDAEVVLLYALSSRVAGHNAQASRGVRVKTLGVTDSAVRRILVSPSADSMVMSALFEYFSGNIEKARSHCTAGLALEPNAWDLLLCQALCERSLGEATEYRESLRASLEASPPPEVAPVLAHALEPS